MSNKENTRQRPRRSRMPAMVYETAKDVYRQLTHWEAWLDHPEHLPDEQLCREIKAPLKRLADLAGIELSKETLCHPHHNPSEVECVIKEAMRLFYGLEDLAGKGEELSNDDLLCRDQMRPNFLLIQEMVTKSEERERRKAQPESEPDKDDCQREYISEWRKCAGEDLYCLVYFTRDIRVGDFIQLHVAGDERGEWWLVQLVKETQEQVIIRRETGEIVSFPAEACRIDGRVIAYEDKDDKPATPPHPMRPESNISNEDLKRIDKLTAKIGKLQDEGDITSCSAIIRMEREIYALEHPVSDDDILSADHIG